MELKALISKQSSINFREVYKINTKKLFYSLRIVHVAFLICTLPHLMATNIN